MSLIYLSPVPWASFAQRPHKFVEWYHRRTGESVIWIDPYPTRLPQVKDFSRFYTSTEAQKFNSTPDWLSVLKPMALPIEPLPGSGWVNEKIWKKLFKEIDELIGNTKILLVIGKPSLLALKLLGRFKRFPSLYDAMDEFPAFYKGLSRIAMAKREGDLVNRVDKIWVSSSALHSIWSQYRCDVALVRNALDPALVPDIPKKIIDSKKKIFGYVGTIASWFDWSWVDALASVRPRDEIRLIGPVFSSSRKNMPPNIVLLPPCSHKAALQAMADFDVGIIPFVKNDLTRSVDPIKYYEYRALGLPVISTNFGEMNFRYEEHGVFISKCLNDVAALAHAALCVDSSALEIAKFKKENSWYSRFDAAWLL